MAFKIAEPDLIPEGIAYDKRTKSFYVGSTYLRKIVRIDKNGVAKNFISEAQDGLRGVLGMRVDEKRRLLWAISSDAGLSMPLKNADRNCIGCSEVFKYDIDTGRLIKRYEIKNVPDKHFLNDIVLGTGGDAYITDTIYGAVYLISAKQDELVEFVKFEKNSYPNGIDLSPDKKKLFVALDGKIAVIDIASKKSEFLVMPPDVKPGIDGMYFYKNSLITIQPFDNGKTVMRYFLNAKQDTVIKIEPVETTHSLLNQPTTGVIVGKKFYFIANSQLQPFRRLVQPDGSFDRSKLSEVVVLQIGL